MHEGLRVLICSNVEYNNLIAEIYSHGKYVALVSQEEGPDRLVVEFPGPDQNEDAIIREVNFDWFEYALRQAKNKLIEQ